MKGLLFTYALTYGGAVVSLFDPFVGLLVYICFAIAKPDWMWFWAVPEGNYSRVVAIGLLVGWALHGFGSWRLGRARAVVVALLAYWLWSLFSITFATNRQIAWDLVEVLGKIVLPFLVGITLIDSVRKLKQIAWVIVLSSGYVAYELNLSYFHGYNRLLEEGVGGGDNNTFAIGMVAAAGLSFFVGLNAQGWWRKALAFGSAALLAHAVLFSFSRGGFLGLILTGVAAFLLIPKRSGHFFVFALACLLVWRLAGKEVTDRFGTAFASEGERDASAQSRVDLWAACWANMLREPWGVGPDQWRLVSYRYGFQRGKEAHSLWMETGAELGFPGLLILVLFYALCVVRLWPLLHRSHPVADPWFRDAARMVMAALLGFAVSAQFVSAKRLEIPFYIVLIGAGVLKLSSVPASSATAPVETDAPEEAALVPTTDQP